MQVKKSHLVNRGQLANLCNEMKLVEAVEVGTDCGQFAFDFLSLWGGNTLVCVDPYEPYLEMEWERDMDKLMAAVRLAPFGWHVKFIMETSERAIMAIPAERPIQFVYIDGSHEYWDVKTDIELWWERLAGGGILAGHDFCESMPNVYRAVLEFATSQDLDLHIIYDPIFAPSWYVFKPKEEESQ